MIIHSLSAVSKKWQNTKCMSGTYWRIFTVYVVVQFLVGLNNFIVLCFKLNIIHYQTTMIIIDYHTPKQRKIKFKPKIKLNHNIIYHTCVKTSNCPTMCSSVMLSWGGISRLSRGVVRGGWPAGTPPRASKSPVLPVTSSSLLCLWNNNICIQNNIYSHSADLEQLCSWHCYLCQSTCLKMNGSKIYLRYWKHCWPNFYDLWVTNSKVPRLSTCSDLQRSWAEQNKISHLTLSCSQ